MNFGLEQQAIGRINRIGQQQQITVVRLICKNTIEENLVKAVSRRMQLAHKSHDDDVSLRATEIAEMFTAGFPFPKH